jgi:hypothetical protein
MTDLTVFLESMNSPEDFTKKFEELPTERQLELQAQLIEFSRPEPVGIDNEAYLEAFRRVQEVDKALRPPSVSEVTFTPDPSDSRQWRAETRVIWSLLEQRTAELAELRQALGQLRSEHQALATQADFTRHQLMRIEARQVVTALSPAERRLVLRLLTKESDTGTRVYDSSFITRLRRIDPALLELASSARPVKQLALAKKLLQLELKLEVNEADTMVDLLRTPLAVLLVQRMDELVSAVVGEILAQEKLAKTAAQARSKRGER